MSLDVSPSLLSLAERDEVADADFLATVRTSLPYAYRLVNDLTAELATSDAEFADNTVAPTDAERAQLLRALASDSIRGALERHFSVKLAFQNCHRLAVFHPNAENTAAYREFTSVRAQLLNQSPELRDC
ncbi:SCO5389 family protein [Kitasatospora sp. NPDC059673]|uniref:SCO5389 family protein n=1 Tax=Kitasatospora sp. NPDC059673 TaxID=3346901 RepID=UPI00368B9A3D